MIVWINKIPFLAVIFLLFSCGSIVPKQPQITETTPFHIPERFGSIELPIEINLKPYLNMVEKELPKTFKGSDSPCEGVAFSYYFKRDTIAFTGYKNTMSYGINGEYNIRANYCAKCADIGNGPFCLAPRIYVSCGVGEPLRKVEIGFESQISLQSNYILKSKTSLVKTKIIDPCELSFLKYDASKIIEKEITEALKDIEKDIDQQIQNVDLKSPINEVWNALQENIKVEGYGFLNLRPQAIDVEPIEFNKQLGLVTANLILSPIFSTDSVSPQKKPLPFLSEIKTKKEFHLPLLALASFDSINAILKTNFHKVSIPYKKKKIVIESAKILGPVGQKALFEVVFSGSKKGKLYMLGTPTFDAKTRIISFPDLEFDIRSRDAILKSAKWLFDKKLTTLLRSKAVYDLSSQLELMRKEIDTQLNSPLQIDKNQYATLKGSLRDFNFTLIEVGAREIRLLAELTGNLSIKL